MSDVSLIAAGQRVEHYEIAVYATLRRGEILALAEGAVVLESVKAEEGNAEELISGTGERVNCQAAALCGQAVYGSCRGRLRSLGGKKNGEVR